MKCGDARKKFMEADNYDSLPVRVRLHAMFCPSCRKEISLIAKVLDVAQNEALHKPDNILVEDIMQRIITTREFESAPVSNFKWIIVGFTIVSSIMLFSFSKNFSYMKGMFGGYIEIPFSIVMGLIVSIYISLFIGTHLEDMKKVKEFLSRDHS